MGETVADDEAPAPFAGGVLVAVAEPLDLGADGNSHCIVMWRVVDVLPVPGAVGVGGSGEDDCGGDQVCDLYAGIVLASPEDRGVYEVGKRVAATGLLTSRELKLNSLRVVGNCN